MAKAISELDRSQPRDGWEDRVRARIAERKAGGAREAVPIRRSAVLRITAAIAIAASIAAVVWIGVPGPDDPRGDRSVIFERASESRRSGSAAPGEVLSMGAELVAGDTIALGVPARGEVRVYRGEREAIFTARTKSSYTLATPGTYRVVWIEGLDAPPPPAGSLEADSAAVLAAGGRFELGPQLNVR